jgi:hypothetical protein
MTRSPEHPDADVNRQRDANTHEVVYLVRRPTYEFVFSVPTAASGSLSGEQARFQARFRERQQEQAFMLSLETLQDFYESLTHLMEYVHIEQQHSRQDQPTPDRNDAPRHG